MTEWHPISDFPELDRDRRKGPLTFVPVKPLIGTKVKLSDDRRGIIEAFGYVSVIVRVM